MKVLIVLTYYRPHTSGLTIYAERLAHALAQRGHQVTVLTSRYERRLPSEERLDGVRVVRAPVLLRISKGVIMPTFGVLAWRLVRDADVVSLHLPQFDAAGIALRGRVLRKPTVLTYHCDLHLPPGRFNRMVNQVVHGMNWLAAALAHRIVAYTRDFAESSAFLAGFSDKLHVVPPPVALPDASASEIAAFASAHNPDGRRPVIGIAARLAAEKGVDVLLKAFPRILERYPAARILAAGQHADVLGERACARQVGPLIRRYARCGQWVTLGVVPQAQMAAFYSNLDILVVPSLNSTESFGLVQVEAMLHGVPCVASDLPGVRQPVQMTGMGEIAPVGDAAGLAAAVARVLDHPARYVRARDAIGAMFAPAQTAAAYERLFRMVAPSLDPLNGG
jgi:glycosyltransferase involved in cell wall biosynthesis